MILKFIKKLDTLTLLVVAVLGIILSIIDLFSFFEKFEWLQNVKGTKYPLLAVSMLSLIAIHLIAVHTTRVEAQQTINDGMGALKKEIKDQALNIIKSLEGVEAQHFDNMIDLENYLAAQLLQAKREVCDLSWKESISQNYDMRVRQESRLNFETNIRKISERVNYREIFIFNDRRRLEKLRNRIEENVDGYSCRYFPQDSDIPRLQFVIIDEKEIIFASSSYPVLCAIQHPEMCQIFKSYYEHAWSKAIPIKSGNQVDSAIVADLLNNG